MLEQKDLFSSDIIVMTLDAGGTNFVFSAIQRGEEVVESFTLPSFGNDLDRSLDQIESGFKKVKSMLAYDPAGISFAFPGPADYPQGIIGDLANLPAYRGGVPLGPMLEHIFKLPVFINNDGDLYAYGESIAGFLPRVNRALESHGSHKRYKNLLGITLGTGFGGGLVHDGKLFSGDNAAAAEVWAIQHPERPDILAEEGLSIRGIKRLFKEFSGSDMAPEPKEIAAIARGQIPGDTTAAIQTYRTFGRILGATLSNVLTVVDAPVVLGGGIAASYDLFIDETLKQLNRNIRSLDGSYRERLEFKVFDFENKATREQFLIGKPTTLVVPGTERQIVYDPEKRIPIGISTTGTSKAIALGAYAIALQNIVGL